MDFFNFWCWRPALRRQTQVEPSLLEFTASHDVASTVHQSTPRPESQRRKLVVNDLGRVLAFSDRPFSAGTGISCSPCAMLTAYTHAYTCVSISRGLKRTPGALLVFGNRHSISLLAVPDSPFGRERGKRAEMTACGRCGDAPRRCSTKVSARGVQDAASTGTLCGG